MAGNANQDASLSLDDITMLSIGLSYEPENAPLFPAIAVPLTFIIGTTTWLAPLSGTVVIYGGVLSLCQLVRGTVSANLPLGGGAVPVERGDGIRITAVGAPTVTFFPGVQPS